MENMHQPTGLMPERRRFGLTFASALMMTNPTMNNRRYRLIGWPSLEHQRKGFSQRNCRKVCSSSASETNQLAINQKQTKYQYTEQPLTKAEPQEDKVQNGVQTYYLEETLLIQLGGRMDNFLRFQKIAAAS